MNQSEKGPLSIKGIFALKTQDNSTVKRYFLFIFYLCSSNFKINQVLYND
jgi:hypothetical protein